MLSIFSCAYWPFVYPLWRNVYSSPLPIFELSCLFFWLLNFRNSLYILDINPMSYIWFVNIFSHSVGCLFTLLMVSFDAQNCLNFHEVQLAYFFFFATCACGILAKKLLPNPVLWSSCPVFSSKSYIVLGLTYLGPWSILS